jgi:hypothetical protein
MGKTFITVGETHGKCTVRSISPERAELFHFLFTLDFFQNQTLARAGRGQAPPLRFNIVGIQNIKGPFIPFWRHPPIKIINPVLLLFLS